jgi:hypothetical protein
MLKRGEKAQASIIVTVLLILIVISGVIVVFNVVNLLLENSAGEISTVDFTGATKLEIVEKSVRYSEIEQGGHRIVFTLSYLGKTPISSMTIILENEDGEGFNYEYEEEFKSLESKEFNIYYGNELEGSVKKILVYPSFGGKRASLTANEDLISVPDYQEGNLIDSTTWVLGSLGSQQGFSKNGEHQENKIILGPGPNGHEVILWEAINLDANRGGSRADGGWNGALFDIDPSRQYRFSVWIKKTNSHSGSSNTFFGAYGGDGLLTLAGLRKTNPYFYARNLPSLDKWYLMVGYIHAHNDASTTNLGALYDGETGEKIVVGISDYKFASTSARQRHRAYLYYADDLDDRQYFFNPRVDMIDGNQPTISELLGR